MRDPHWHFFSPQVGVPGGLDEISFAMVKHFVVERNHAPHTQTNASKKPILQTHFLQLIFCRSASRSVWIKIQVMPHQSIGSTNFLVHDYDQRQFLTSAMQKVFIFFIFSNAPNKSAIFHNFLSIVCYSLVCCALLI